MRDFKWRHYRGEIILSCVRWYCKYGISYRVLEEMMLERGVNVDHTTLYGHARAIIIDEEKALIGTAQLSPPSLDENREVSMIIKGPVVSQLLMKFEEDQKTVMRASSS